MNTTESELLPCPFCGGPVSLEKTVRLCNGFGVVCRNTTNLGGSCCMEQVPSASKEAAITRWNTRARPPAPAPQWLPIDDAARTSVTVWLGDRNNIRLGHWCAGNEHECRGSIGGGWIDFKTERGLHFAPTHYMPIPAAPGKEG